MSFLDSILNEISGAEAPPGARRASTPRARDFRPAVKQESPAKNKAYVKKESATEDEGPVTNGSSYTPILPKRKASGDLGNSSNKLAKKEDGTASDNRRGSTLVTPSTVSQPYKGTAGLDRSKLPTRPLKPTPVSAGPANAASAPVAKPAPKPSAPSTVTTSSKTQSAPKKGSYAEMLARAKAASNSSYTGIKHKPTEKLKPAKQAPEEKLKAVERDREKKRSVGSAEVQSGGESDKNAEKRRKHTELGYKGTMRGGPTELAYKGTMQTKVTDANRDRLGEHRRSLDAGRGRGREKRYDDGGDEEEDDDENGRDGYDDESDLSDMEADMWEVDEEETKATRIARDEDRKEQELEAQLQREKKAKRDAVLKNLQARAIARSDKRRQLR